MNKTDFLDNIINYEKPKRNKFQELDLHANHTVNSMINLIAFIDDNFEQEESEELFRKIILSIKSKDYDKFKKTLERMEIKRESNNEEKS